LFIALTQVGQQMGVVVRSSSSQLNRLQSLAATDGLTGLVNRRQFNHQLQSEIARAKRHALPLSLALFDIDDFKKLNDTYGHPIGDRVLKDLGKLVTQNIRECDISARYGGEEFALILPETRQMEAYELLERLRALVERTVFCLPDNPLTISISVGVAQMDFNQATAVSLVEKSDAALYEAKRKGKNQVVFGTIPTPKITLTRQSIH
jgi:diguanylate cyclase (GGDEF)-like protein